ncbi:MAG: TonB-dependent receptor [Gemmatimonadaceae bacterium]|nr:TonB-dependent receptor [Gemmatimonadaceae bacterium]
MQVLRSAVVALAISISAAASHAQGAPGPQPPAVAPGEIRGMIVDEAGIPVGRASIAVRSALDSAIIAGGFAAADGSFRIQGLRPGAYLVRVTLLGIRPVTRPVTIDASAPRAVLGTIEVSRIAVALQGVEVAADRDAVTIEPDRNSYRSKEVAPAATNASEVLEAVPSVQVDGEGKVSLRGNENVAVQINGRPSPLRGAQLAAYLKSLPSSVIDRVEVVPNPSAKYDPEGMAGIINVVLKQNVDLGLSGGVTVSAANRSRYSGSGNLGYQRGKLTLFGNYGHFGDTRDIVGINDRERFDALQSLRSVTEQEIAEVATNRGHNLSTSADYKLNARDVIYNALTLNMRRGRNDLATAYAELDADRSLIENYGRSRDATAEGMMVDYNLAVKRTFEPRKHELGAELRYNQAQDDERIELFRVATSGPAVERESSTLDAVTKQLTAQVDYTRTLAARTKLESGYKGTSRWLDRDYAMRVDGNGDGTWTPSPRSNAFGFDEQVQAVYAVLSHGTGKFDLQGGLRGEYATRDFALSTDRYPYEYASLFPSGVVSYSLTDASQVKASYSRRIRRPGTQELNPFPQYMDAQNVFIGNPSLAPEYTDAFELGYTKSGRLGSVQVSPFFRKTSNIIRVDINTADVLEGREVTSVSFRNVATSDSWGTDLNGSLRMGDRFSGFTGFNVYKIVTDGGSESTLASDAVAWSGRVNGTAQVTKSVSVQASYFYRAPLTIERGRFAAQQSAGLSVRQKLMGDAATVTLRLADPFNTGGFKIQTGDDNVMQYTERKFGVRAAFLTFQYTFGQAPRIRQQAPPPQQGGSTGFPTG